MKEFKYNLGKSKTGAYADLNNRGQCYNVQLLLQSFSRNKTGVLKISFKKQKGWMRATKDKSNNGFDAHCYLDQKVKLTHQVSFDREDTNAKVIYLKVIPSKNKTPCTN